MRLLFVVDGRSPIALNWIDYFARRDHEVHLISTFPGEPEIQGVSQEFIPVAFSAAKKMLAVKDASSRAASPKIVSGLWGSRLVGLRTGVRQWLGPLTILEAAGRLAKAIQRIKPDLIHAMRIPYEGMLAVSALQRIRTAGGQAAPILISIWGNDFTLHARSNPWMAYLTRQVMHRADALHTDCYRDQSLSRQWGFEPAKPAIVVPGNGGIQLDLFMPGEVPTEPVVINPRGVRAYVRNDTFFQAIPQVLKSIPSARFVCTGMQGETQALRWVSQLGISQSVELLPRQARAQMANLFRNAQVVVSPTIHDGTPNTLLEALACGCFPVVGNIESLREWISQGENGFLFDPYDPKALAEAVIRALSEPPLRLAAARLNQELIAERADYTRIMPQVEAFYRKIAGE